MPRPIPNKQDRTVWPDSRYSLSTAHCPLLSALCFHGLTNCFSHKLFALINICVAPGCHPQQFTRFRNSGPERINSFIVILL